MREGSESSAREGATAVRARPGSRAECSGPGPIEFRREGAVVSCSRKANTH